MVRILSTGEIVGDDDPRGRQPSSRGGNSSGQPRQGFAQLQHNDDDAQQNYMQGQQQVSIFDALNQRLLTAGLPRFNAGPYTVEPIVSVAFLLAGLFFGLKGMLFALVLFFVSKWSQHGLPNFGAPGQQRSTGGGGGGGGAPGGSGHRLGRS